jgi:hypothetical protein
MPRYGVRPASVRRELFSFQAIALVDLNEILDRNGNVFRIAAVGTKSGPPSMRADLCVALMAVPTGFVSPSPYDDDLIALLEAGRFRYEASDLVDLAGDLVPWRQREGCLAVGAKVPVQQLDVGAAHAGGAENLIWLDLGDRDIFQNERLVVTVHACRSHGIAPDRALMGITMMAWAT